MLKFPSGCKIRENLFHGGSIICPRSSFSDTLGKLHGWGVPVLERGIVWRIELLSAVPTPLDRFPWHGFKLSQFSQRFTDTFPDGVDPSLRIAGYVSLSSLSSLVRCLAYIAF